MKTTPFEFATATRLVFGPGRVRELGSICSALGRRALVATGSGSERWDLVEQVLHASGVEAVRWVVSVEPTLDLVRAGVDVVRAQGCDCVVSVGGGSVIDAGKAVAALVTNPGDVLDYLEVVGAGRPLTVSPLPFVAVPTTAGTGAEVTRNAVLGVTERAVKASLRSPLLLARAAVVDSELTLSMPPMLTVATGLDALTQLIEPFLSVRANPMTDALCREAIPRAARSLPLAVRRGGEDRGAREEMALASLFSGLALANAGLGAVHGFAAPLGGLSGAAHGAICAALLPHVMKVNLVALRIRDAQGEGVRRFEETARLLTGRSSATADDGVRWLEELCRDLEVEPLRNLGVAPKDFEVLVERASQASSMKGNPVALTRSELREILERAY